MNEIQLKLHILNNCGTCSYFFSNFYNPLSLRDWCCIPTNTKKYKTGSIKTITEAINNNRCNRI